MPGLEARVEELGTAVKGDFSIARAEVDGVPTLSVSGDVDLTTSPLLSQSLEQAVEEGHSTVDLDLSGVRFFDSSGARVLLDALAGEAPPSPLRLTRASESVRRVLNVLLVRQPPRLPSAS